MYNIFMIDILQKAARAGGEVLMKYFRTDHSVKHKTTHQNLVTQADIESQEAIHRSLLSSMIKAGYKKDELGFIGEEDLHVKGRHLFIIDPLDGTNNFASGFDYFCIPIAYLKDRKPVASVVYHPKTKVLYTAEAGKGAFKGILDKSPQKQKRLRLRFAPLQDSLMMAGISSSSKIKDAQISIYTKLHPHFRGFRNLGCAGLDYCLFAENIFGAVINGKNYIWDIAATKLIIEESGGVLVDWEGREVELDLDKSDKPYKTIACHPKNLPKILKYF